MESKQDEDTSSKVELVCGRIDGMAVYKTGDKSVNLVFELSELDALPTNARECLMLINSIVIFINQDHYEKTGERIEAVNIKSVMANAH